MEKIEKRMYPESKLDSESGYEDYDEGYSKSDDNRTSKSTASSISLTSSTSSNQLSVDAPRQRTEVIKKISVSHAVNDAIFKPDYRLSCKQNGLPKYWGAKSIDEIDHVMEHAEEHGDEDRMDHLVRMFASLLAKLYVRCTLEKSAVSYDGPVIKIHITNKSTHPISQLHLIWINLFEHKVDTMDEYTNPRHIPAFGSIDVYVPITKFVLGKDYKLIIYYGQDTICSREYPLKITTRPISTMYLEKLDHYFPDPTVRKLDRNHYKIPQADELLEEMKDLKQKIVKYEKSETASRLNSTNYHSMCKLLLQMEDETDSKRSLRHDQYNQRVKFEFGTRYSLKINNHRLESAINEYMRIWITPMSVRMAEQKMNTIHAQNALNGRRSGPRTKKERIYGSVVEIKGDTVYFDLDESLNRFSNKTNINPADQEYFIRFMNDRTSVTLEHRALDYVDDHEIAHLFFPCSSAIGSPPTNTTHPSSFTTDSITWSSDDINHEQKAAVINILRQTSYPYPYLLFGPPGTGKTKTLTESILQIIRKNNPDEYILVCATSNSACNEVAMRLIQNGCAGSVLRIFSKNVALKMAGIPREVLAASNLQTGEHYYPSLQVIYQHKVIVCTLTTAGRLSQGKINPQHFSHVFIDEAGSATETQTLIAVAGVCTSQSQLHANVIFAGDPKQLGPLIKSQHAIKMGYGVSMLERLITTNSLYMPDEKTNEFNGKYVTQLIRNYRSHSSILHSSNHLYYNSVLRVCAPACNTDWFLSTNILKEPQFPMVFHSIKGNTVRDQSSTSSYNQIEIDMLLNYLKRIFNMMEPKIVQSDIGIISPYRRQCEELTRQCEQNGYNDIQIGSVEVFQGQEKPIIIVSTVRSQMDNIGFLDNKKRLNVLMTRAKCLLIIIGDADTLAKDKDWAYVIGYCKANNALIE